MKIDFKHFFKRLYQKTLFEEDIISTGAQVAFYFSFALFPLMIFLFSSLGLMMDSTEDLRKEIFFYLSQVMPNSAFELVRTTINEVTESSSGKKLTFGILIALWSASSGVDSLRIALNSVYNLDEYRSWIRTRVTAMISTLVLTLLIIFALAIVFYGWKFLSLALGTLSLPVPSPFVLTILQWIVIFIVLLIVFALIYSILPSHNPFKWVWISPGAFVGIFLWLGLSYIFRLYLSYFDTYDKTYGSLGAVIILLLWLLLTAIVILVGGIINAILQEMTDPETAAKADEKSIVKLEQAKSSIASDRVDEMIEERQKDCAPDDEECEDEEEVTTTSPDLQLQPIVYDTRSIADVKAELPAIKSPNKTIIGLTAAGVFGFLMGAMFKKKDRN